VDELADDLRGRLVRPTDPDYDEARSVWNGMIDQRPDLVVEATGTADVIAAVEFAREHQRPVAVRGGGHSVAGDGTTDDGIVIDLGALDEVRLDPETERVHVGPGATLGDVDHETQAFGLAVPSGVVSMTGMAGLTLGGGVGWLMREHGLTCDHLVEAHVVTAEGELVRASEDENADLFWALQGGGGNFGIVTRFTYDTVELGPTVYAGANLHPARDAREVLDFYEEWTARAPTEVVTAAIVKTAPETSEIPAEHRGEPVLALAACYAGDPDRGRKVLEPLTSFGDPIHEDVRERPFTEWQSSSDDAWQPGYRDYWKSCYLDELPDEVLEAMVERVHEMPSTIMDVKLEHAGGAMAEVDEHASAFSGRWAEHIFKINGRWEDPAEDEDNIAWVRELFEDVAEHVREGVYVNYLARDDEDRIEAAYGKQTYKRLRQVKANWDPDNRFSVNQNIRPASD
jgi:FAD/FMN-containing dehydrogenase